MWQPATELRLRNDLNEIFSRCGQWHFDLPRIWVLICISCSTKIFGLKQMHLKRFGRFAGAGLVGDYVRRQETHGALPLATADAFAYLAASWTNSNRERFCAGCGHNDTWFSWNFRPFQLVVTPPLSFLTGGNMATAASRYYSEDGRASKRQKTDGMDTVSLYLNGVSFQAVHIFFGDQNGFGCHVWGFYSLNYAMTKCLARARQSLANMFG